MPSKPTRAQRYPTMTSLHRLCCRPKPTARQRARIAAAGRALAEHDADVRAQAITLVIASRR